MDLDAFVKEIPIDDTFSQIFILYDSDRYNLSNFIDFFEKNDAQIDTIKLIPGLNSEKVAFIKLKNIETSIVLIKMMEIFNVEIKANGPILGKKENVQDPDPF